MGYIDLHVHSTASDGSYSPSELVRYACEKGLSAFALTDHDCVDGIAYALQAAKDYPVKVIPGVEVTSSVGNLTIHMLGYNIDYESPELLRRLSIIRSFKDERNIKMCAQLRAYGMNIDYEDLKAWCGCRSVTRNHFASFLVEKGYVSSKAEAFEKYIAKGRPCYIPQQKISASDAIRLILRAGGIPVMAHPVQCRLDEEGYKKLFLLLKSCGLVGIEAMYVQNTAEQEMMFRSLADEFGFIITGGSDFHGMLKPDIEIGTGHGNLMIPESLLEQFVGLL